METAEPRTWVRVARDSWWKPRALGTVQSNPGQLVNPAGYRVWPESPRRAGQHRGPLDPSAIRLGELVETASPRTRALVALESWSTTQFLGPGPKRPGQLVDPAGTRTRMESPE